MADLPIDIIEAILKRLDAKDLIRYRIISKLWDSSITSFKFIKSHLNHSYQREIENEKIGSQRIVMSCIGCCKSDRTYVAAGMCVHIHNHCLLGSSNGLVCISPSRYEFLVINPETREVKMLKKPQIPAATSLTYGFGYNSCNDDYVVIIGFEPVNGVTRFLMFSLNSNRWEIIGNVYYSFITRIGILTNGALHWVAYRGDPRNQIHVILSFDLSTNKFIEIPHPDDARYEKDVAGELIYLGVRDGLLCAYSLFEVWVCSGDLCPNNTWVMSKYGVKESWKLVGPEGKTNIEIVHRLKELKNYIPKTSPLCASELLVGGPEFLGAPRFIPSLVSPYVGEKPREKRDPSPYLEWLVRRPKLLGAPSFIPSNAGNLVSPPESSNAGNLVSPSETSNAGNLVSPPVGKKPRKTRDPASYRKTGSLPYSLFRNPPESSDAGNLVSPQVGKKPRKERDPASYRNTGRRPPHLF